MCAQACAFSASFVIRDITVLAFHSMSDSIAGVFWDEESLVHRCSPDWAHPSKYFSRGTVGIPRHLASQDGDLCMTVVSVTSCCLGLLYIHSQATQPSCLRACIVPSVGSLAPTGQTAFADQQGLYIINAFQESTLLPTEFILSSSHKRRP